MVTKAKPINTETTWLRFPYIILDDAAKRSIAKILGIASNKAGGVFREIEIAMSEGAGRVQFELTRPLPPQIRGELAPATRAVEQARKKVKQLSWATQTLLRGTYGEENTAGVKFVTSADALLKRIREVHRELCRWEKEELRQTLEGDNPSSGGARKRRAKEALSHEPSQAAKALLEMSSNLHLFSRGDPAPKRTIQIDSDPARWTSMRTALIGIYERWGATPADNVQRSKFIKTVEKAFNEGMQCPRTD